MKPLALLMMLIALYLLYRIAFPKQPDAKKGNDSPLQKTDDDLSELVVKSRFVRPDFGQPQTTRTTTEKSDFQEEKPYIFAAGNEKRDAVIPIEKLDEVFGEEFNGEALNEVNPEDLDIPPDEDEETGKAGETGEMVDIDEEAEELRQTLGRDAEFAGGWSIEELAEVTDAIDHPTDDKADILFRVEKTDMFEQLVSGDAGKAALITAVIDRYVSSQKPEVESEVSDNEWKDFDVQNFLSKTIKK